MCRPLLVSGSVIAWSCVGQSCSYTATVHSGQWSASMQAFTVLPLTLWLASLVAALTGRAGDPPLTDKQRQLVILLHVRSVASQSHCRGAGSA